MTPTHPDLDLLDRRRRSLVFQTLLAVLFPVALAVATPRSSIRAQERDPIPLSQHQRLTQSVGWAQLSVEYRRPGARGRALFGELIPWDAEWTPSADSAAVLTLSEDMLVGEQAVPAGAYSLWLVPRAKGPWTLVLSRAARVYHSPYPAGQDLVRIDVSPEAGSYMETLAMYFPVVAGPTAVLHIHWGDTVVPIHLRLP